MSCEEARAQLPDYTLGTLPNMEAAAVRRHLRGCAGCRSEAATLDEGVALFASSAHAVEPPSELRDRIMAVLSEEWSEAPGPRSIVPRLMSRWPAMAAAAAVIVALVVAGLAQAQIRGFRQDALHYREFLHTLGGKDVRVARLSPARSITLEGSAIVYDAEHGEQSWVLVLARAPGFAEQVTVSLEASEGRSISIPFRLRFDENGDAWTGLTTSSDLSKFNRIVLTTPSGRVVATGTVREG
jgi:putative zinc finger protein